MEANLYCYFFLTFLFIITRSTEVRAAEEHKDCGCSSGISRSKVSQPSNEDDPEQHNAGLQDTELPDHDLQDTVLQDPDLKSETKVIPPTRTNQMVYIEGETFTIGNVKPIYMADGEGPTREATVSSFWMDVHEVSNGEFKIFVDDTGHVTEAETFGNSFAIDGYLSENVKENITECVKAAPWWLQVNDTNWKHPFGPDTNIKDSMDHPVVHVSWNDAVAYCKWAEKRLPTEAEWEMACRSGKTDRLFPWGNNEMPQGMHRMNIWQGDFPLNNTAEDGYAATCPVTAFPAQTKHGLKNIIGNAWEWVSDWWQVRHFPNKQINPVGPRTGTDKVKKGGSYLCTTQYCYRYRCGARSQNTPDSTSMNVGFRCASEKLPSYLVQKKDEL